MTQLVVIIDNFENPKLLTELVKAIKNCPRYPTPRFYINVRDLQNDNFKKAHYLT